MSSNQKREIACSARWLEVITMCCPKFFPDVHLFVMNLSEEGMKNL
jgi:hypothetical protein